MYFYILVRWLNGFPGILGVSHDSATINHYVSLIRCELFEMASSSWCCAGEFCKVREVGHTFRCRYCLLNFHVSCVYPRDVYPQFTDAECGCHLLLQFEKRYGVMIKLKSNLRQAAVNIIVIS